jgi:protein-tyrosine phosphatase
VVDLGRCRPIHLLCVAGKDRTGIVAGLVLALAGVPRETIAAEYALSNACIRIA